MYFLLQAVSGPYTGRKIPVPLEGRVSIGREETANYAFFSDTFMSRVHAELLMSGRQCILHDNNSSNGTFLNGRRVEREATIRTGDRIQIGETYFEVSEETLPLEKLLPEMELDASQAATYAVLRAQGLRLYGVIDVAANPQIITMLRNGQTNYQSIFEEAQRDDGFDPHLVSIPQKIHLLNSLVSEGWGNHWGLYLTTEEGFRKVIRHLRETLLEEMRPGRTLPTRFTDLLALTTFFRSMPLQQRERIFGPVYAFFTEDPAGTPFCSFTRDGSEPMRGSMLFSAPLGGDFDSTSILKPKRK
jgi:pSer/pThr/pTyr-binding forkhead associated (FHA) protein